MTRVSQKKKDLLFTKYQEIKNKSEKAKINNNIPMYEIYNQKLKTIRMTLSLLEIHYVNYYYDYNKRQIIENH